MRKRSRQAMRDSRLLRLLGVRTTKVAVGRRHATAAVRCLVIGLLALAALVVPAQAARSDNGGNADVIGGVVQDLLFTPDQPVQLDTLASGTSLPATLNWAAGFSSQPPDFPALPDPTVAIDSGYPASELSFCNGGTPTGPVGALPIVVSDPGSTGVGTGICSMIPATIQTGCDLTRSVTPLEVPVGGGNQTFSVTVRCTDPAVNEIQSYVGAGTDGAWASLSSFEPPDLSQGEQLASPTQVKPGEFSLDLSGVVTGKPYTFTFVFAIPNPFGAPLIDKPNVFINDWSPMPGGCTTGCGPQTSVAITDPTLDGPTPGAGQVTFSDTEPHMWYVGRARDREYGLSGITITGPTTKDQCKNGGWQTFGVFKNQGDCVSYVATGGKNPPSGP